MKAKTYYKKIVTYNRNKEGTGILSFTYLFLGMGLGWILRAISPTPDNIYMIITLLSLALGFLIVNFFITHDRKVKYEKYECKRK